VPDSDGVPRLCAFVAVGEGFDPGELRRRLLGELAPHKVPSLVRAIDTLPRTDSGKLLRSRLEELAAATRR
jgi:acyl-coenzyme A synthetase/AMP-(fatty) acid ligase